MILVPSLIFVLVPDFRCTSDTTPDAGAMFVICGNYRNSANPLMCLSIPLFYRFVTIFQPNRYCDMSRTIPLVDVVQSRLSTVTGILLVIASTKDGRSVSTLKDSSPVCVLPLFLARLVLDTSLFNQPYGQKCFHYILRGDSIRLNSWLSLSYLLFLSTT